MHFTIPFAWAIVFLHFAPSTFRASALAAAVASVWHLLPSWCGSFHSELAAAFHAHCFSGFGTVYSVVQTHWLFHCRDFGLVSTCMLASLPFGYLYTVKSSLTCVVVQVDHSDVALGATSIRLHCAQLPWTVATPPIQAYHPISSSASSWWDFIFIQ